MRPVVPSSFYYLFFFFASIIALSICCKAFQLSSPYMPMTATTLAHRRSSNSHKTLLSTRTTRRQTTTRIQASINEDKDDDITSRMQPQTKDQNGVLFMKIIQSVGSTTSLVVGGSVFLAIAYFRNALTVSLFVGAVANGILSKILKRLLQQQRPIVITTNETTSNDSNIPNDHGMPSSHAMSLGFIGMFTVWQFPVVAGPLAIYVAMSLFYRVRVKAFHTWEQIMVGLILGSINGSLWWHWTTDPSSWWITWISEHVLLTEGLLPYSMLWVPLLVGGLTVSSFERKISSLFGGRRSKKVPGKEHDS